MALPRKNTRLITVDDIEYRWKASGNDYGIELFIELSKNPNQLLKALAPYQYSECGTHMIVSPKSVEYVIRAGLELGWEPDSGGGTFKYKGEVPLVEGAKKL